MAQEKRLGIIGIVVSDLEKAERVNEVIHEFKEIIVARMGIPYKARNVSVISLLIDGNLDRINAFTGALGSIPDVTARSMLHKIS